jgi:hypothetical protein
MSATFNMSFSSAMINGVSPSASHIFTSTRYIGLDVDILKSFSAISSCSSLIAMCSGCGKHTKFTAELQLVHTPI